MIYSRPFLSVRMLGALIAVVTIVLGLACVSQASAYSKPPGGKWNFRNLFEDTTRGALSLSKDGSKVINLVLVPGEDEIEECGKEPIRLVTRPAVKSYRKANGRYAVANIKGGLFVGTSPAFNQGKGTFRSSLQLIWDETGRLLDEGQYEHGDCYLSFYARKGS